MMWVKGNQAANFLFALLLLLLIAMGFSLFWEPGSDKIDSDSEENETAKISATTPQNKVLSDALFRAIRSNNKTAVKKALDSGISPNAVECVECGSPAINEAVRSGNVEIVKLLLDAGAEVNIHKDSPLFNAAFRRNAPMVQLLLDHGGDPNLDDGAAFHYACTIGDVQMVEAFLKAGANVNIRDANRDVPLISAVKGDLLKTLLPIKDEMTPEKIEASINEAPVNISVIRLLLSKGADPNAKDSGGDTALYYAASNQHPDIVRELMAHGSRPELATFRKGGIFEDPKVKNNPEMLNILRNKSQAR